MLEYEQMMDERLQQIEKSINKTFRPRLWSPFVKAVKEYELIKEGDKIAVCISGGKDSMCLAKLMQMLHRYSDFPFEVVYLVMDPGYNELNRLKIEENGRILGLPLTIFDSKIFAIANAQDRSPCYLCAKMRRGALYSKAKELGCNKIALGHHFDDVIETTLIGMFYASKLEAMMPKLHSRNFAGMELIRPLYRVREEDIIAWAKHNDLHFIRCACAYTEKIEESEDGIGVSKRKEIKELLKQLHKDNPDIEKSIFNSIHNVSIETFPGHKDDEGYHFFLEGYDKKNRNMR